MVFRTLLVAVALFAVPFVALAETPSGTAPLDSTAVDSLIQTGSSDSIPTPDMADSIATQPTLPTGLTPVKRSFPVTDTISVKVEMMVGPSGEVESVRVIKPVSIASLNERAEEAAWNWKFPSQPGRPIQPYVKPFRFAIVAVEE
jgi:TonB family protein